MKKEQVLLIDDEEGIRYAFHKFLVSDGYSVVTAENYREGIARLDESSFDLIFADIILGDKTGIDLLREVKERKLRCPVVIFTGAPSIATASEAIRIGAFDYLSKPVEKNALLRVAKIALKHKALLDENEKYRTNLAAIFRSVKDAIITVDDDLSVLEINDAGAQICGLSRAKVLGRKLNLVQNNCGGKCLNVLTEAIQKREPAEIYRVECGWKSEKEQVVSMSVYPLLMEGNRFSGAVMVVRDETRLAVLERNLNERRRFHKIIGESKEVQKIYSLIEKLMDVSTTVLITGESGTGKELVVEALHYRGKRKDNPLVKVNCSALTEELLESELFGHVKGAFTGALEDKKGRFQIADGGTLFLDEIGDVSPRSQLRLLRVLDNKEFERVGSTEQIKVDVRFLAATNKDLPKLVKLGKFREDLFYRLQVVELALPPLRDRLEDIPLLLEHFLEKFNKKFNKRIEGVSEEVKRQFMDYSWPGNIRELEHIMEHAFILCGQPIISLKDLPKSFRDPGTRRAFLKEKTTPNNAKTILQALEKSGWNKAKAARFLGISRQTLYQKIKEYKIQEPDSCKVAI